MLIAGVVLLGFIWFAVWAAILSFSIGKWIPTIGAWVHYGGQSWEEMGTPNMGCNTLGMAFSSVPHAPN